MASVRREAMPVVPPGPVLLSASAGDLVALGRRLRSELERKGPGRLDLTYVASPDCEGDDGRSSVLAHLLDARRPGQRRRDRYEPVVPAALWKLRERRVVRNGHQLGDSRRRALLTAEPRVGPLCTATIKRLRSGPARADALWRHEAYSPGRARPQSRLSRSTCDPDRRVGRVP